MAQKSNFMRMFLLLIIATAYSVKILDRPLTNTPNIPFAPIVHAPKTANSPSDADGDGLPDFWEIKYGDLNPHDDSDQDDLSNLE